MVLVENCYPHSRVGRGELLCAQQSLQGRVWHLGLNWRWQKSQAEMEYKERQLRAGQAPDLIM